MDFEENRVCVSQNNIGKLNEARKAYSVGAFFARIAQEYANPMADGLAEQASVKQAAVKTIEQANEDLQRAASGLAGLIELCIAGGEQGRSLSSVGGQAATSYSLARDNALQAGKEVTGVVGHPPRYVLAAEATPRMASIKARVVAEKGERAANGFAAFEANARDLHDRVQRVAEELAQLVPGILAAGRGLDSSDFYETHQADVIDYGDKVVAVFDDAINGVDADIANLS